ncbi:MAG: Phosphate-selective porin [Pseudomonadota bacterium]|jgi:hypothetical protein
MIAGALLPVLVLASRPPLRLGTGDAHADVGVALQLRTTTTVRFDSAAYTELDIRRLRLSLRGEGLDRRVRFGFQVNTTPRALELMDAWVEWRPCPALSLRAGQVKTPLTRHRQQRFSELAFVDWGLAVFHFGAERQLGLSTHVGGEDAALTFDGGLFNGQNARTTFERGIAEAWGTPMPNPSDLRTPPVPLPFHPEWVGRLTWSSGGARTAPSVDGRGGPLRVTGSLGAAWDLGPVRKKEFRGRLAPEVLVQYQHWSLDLGTYLGWAHLAGSEVDLASVGVNAELSRWLEPGVVLGLRFSSVTRLPRFVSHVESRTGRPPSPQTHEVTAAATLPLAGDLLHLQVDAAWMHDAQDAFRARTQVQLAW